MSEPHQPSDHGVDRSESLDPAPASPGEAFDQPMSDDDWDALLGPEPTGDDLESPTIAGDAAALTGDVTDPTPVSMELPRVDALAVDDRANDDVAVDGSSKLENDGGVVADKSSKRRARLTIVDDEVGGETGTGAVVPPAVIPTVAPVEPAEPSPVRVIVIGGEEEFDDAPAVVAGETAVKQRRRSRRAAKKEAAAAKPAAIRRSKRTAADAAGPVANGGSQPVRKVVITEDDDPIDLSSLPPAGQVDPRVRKRRIAVKRAAGLRRFRWVIVFGVLTVMIVAALVVLASPMFAVKRIEVVGANYTTAEELSPILAEFDGKPILTLNPKKLEAEVEALPWVRRAAVDIGFPDTLTINIAERKPAATYRGLDGRWRVIDRSARVIAIEIGQPADFLPVAGAGPDLEPGDTAGATIATLAELAEVISKLPQLDALVVRLSADGTDLTMTMVTPGGSAVEVVLGTTAQLRTKLSVLLTILNDPEFVIDDVVRINLTDPAKPAY